MERKLHGDIRPHLFSGERSMDALNIAPAMFTRLG